MLNVIYLFIVYYLLTVILFQSLYAVIFSFFILYYTKSFYPQTRSIMTHFCKNK